MTGDPSRMRLTDSARRLRTFRGYDIAWLFGAGNSAETRAALVRFWADHGAIDDPFAAWRRTFEVGAVALDGQGDIAGVSSFYPDILPADGRPYWFYRTFVRPDSRVVGLAPQLFDCTFATLAVDYGGEPGAPEGVVTIMENPKLDTPAGLRVIRQSGLTLLGTDVHGRSVWRRRFADT